MAQDYSAQEVADLLGVSAAEVRQWATAGILSAQPGADGTARFSFQDLVLLKRAAALVSGKVSRRRVREALLRLREQLPDAQPLTAVQVETAGAEVLAREASCLWEPISGQVRLDFGTAASRPAPQPSAPRTARVLRLVSATEKGSGAEAHRSAEQAYEEACRLEDLGCPDAADAYQRALKMNPAHAEARINFGRMLHATGRLAEAAAQYQKVLARGPHPLASFNLGVALEDLGKTNEAIAAYQATIAGAPEYEDAYFNLARIYERRGERAAALRALKTYRNLTRSS